VRQKRSAPRESNHQNGRCGASWVPEFENKNGLKMPGMFAFRNRNPRVLIFEIKPKAELKRLINVEWNDGKHGE